MAPTGISVASTLVAALLMLFSSVDGQRDTSTGLTEQSNSQIISADYEDLVIESVVHEKSKFTDARLKLDRQIIGDVGEFIIDASKKLLYDDQSIFIYSLSNAGKFYNLYNTKRAELANFVKHDASEIQGEYNGMVRKFFYDLTTTKTNIRMTGREAHRHISRAMKALENLIRVSPTGLCIDWQQIVINGIPFDEFIAPVMQYISDSGRGLVLPALRKIGDNLMNI